MGGERWHEALATLGEMRQRHVRPDAISFNAAITACEKCERWQESLGVLCEMLMQRVQPNVPSYYAAVTACENGDWWQSLRHGRAVGKGGRHFWAVVSWLDGCAAIARSAQC